MPDSSTPSPNVERVKTWSADKNLGALWQELHRRMSASPRPVSSVQVPLDPATNRDLSSLLGRKSRFESDKAKVSIPKLRRQLGLNDQELRLVVQALVGPIVDRAGQRALETEQRQQVSNLLRERLAPRAPRSAEKIRSAPIVGKSLEEHQEQILTLLNMVDALPLTSPKPLAMFSWRYTQDPHGLDAGTNLHKWLGWILAELEGSDLDEISGPQLRAAGAAQGLIFDRLFTPTLTHAVQADPNTPAGRVLTSAWRDNVPLHLSSFLLDQGEPKFTDRHVLCVENPSVVEWINIHAKRVPVVCSSGWPSHDAHRLLSTMAEQGITLHYAGDFDPSGLRIAEHMHRRFGATVQMSVQDYLSAQTTNPVKWRGDVPPTPWCPKLHLQIRETRLVHYQEDPVLLARLLERFSQQVPS